VFCWPVCHIFDLDLCKPWFSVGVYTAMLKGMLKVFASLSESYQALACCMLRVLAMGRCTVAGNRFLSTLQGG